MDLEKGFYQATGLSSLAYKRKYGAPKYHMRQSSVMQELVRHRRNAIIVFFTVIGCLAQEEVDDDFLYQVP